MALFNVQSAVLTAIAWLTMGLTLWAFVDACLRKPGAFVAANRLTKQAWLLILGLAVAVQFLLGSGLGLLAFAGIVAVLVYLLVVRPAVREYRGR